MNLIGINGFKRSGKDTAGHLIAEIFAPERVQRVAFADKLKIMAANALGWEGDNDLLVRRMNSLKDGDGKIFLSYEGDNLNMDLSFRAYLQNFGNHARRLFGENFWIDQVLPAEPVWDDPLEISNSEALAEKYPDTDVVVVTDVRYPNEAERIIALGGWVLEVVRPGIESDGHASEQPLPRNLVDHQILNDGTIDKLRERLQGILTS